jgi:type IV secretion system protein VirB10
MILLAVVVLIGLSNLASLIGGHKKTAQKSTLVERPATPNSQQVANFEAQQALQAKKDAEEQARQALIAAQMKQFQDEATPGPEADNAALMTAAQRKAIYGDSQNAPKQTSGSSEAQAQAKQRILERQKQRQDALNSGTVAIDFAHQTAATAQTAATPAQTAVLGDRDQASSQASSEEIASAGEGTATRPATAQASIEQPVKAATKADPMGNYDFDTYEGKLYRVFEGTVLEGVVTNHIDGGFNGPILVMLTTDYYSHNHQQLLMPQGTRLIGTVQSVGSSQQRKMFVTFHRAVCPDGFSLDFDKYIGLDPIGTTGLASKVDHGYLMAFGAAAAIGGIGGLAQIGNNASVLDSSTQIRNGISAQTSQEAEQILNHFLNRLPVITLKEGSRARVYIGRDILIPSYAEHRVDPTI